MERKERLFDINSLFLYQISNCFVTILFLDIKLISILIL